MLSRTIGFTRAAVLALALALPLASGAGAQTAGQQQGAAQQQGATPFRPVAVVNGSAITGFDLIQRAQIMLALGFQAPSEQALRSAALDRMIEDRLKSLEADRLGLTATNEEIQAGIVELAQGVGLAPEKMLEQLAAAGVSRKAVEELVAADVLWRKVVRTRFAGQLNPDEEQVDAEIDQLTNRNTVAYRLAEIGLPLNTEERTPEETRALAERLSRQLSTGGDFPEAVDRYSRAVSAAQGGEVGWVTSDSLPPEVADALAGLQPGDVSRPVPVEGGISILKVLEMRQAAPAEIGRDDPRLREQVSAQISGRQAQRLAEGLLQELRRDALIEVR